jgi:hypothetical protein
MLHKNSKKYNTIFNFYLKTHSIMLSILVVKELVIFLTFFNFYKTSIEPAIRTNSHYQAYIYPFLLLFYFTFNLKK